MYRYLLLVFLFAVCTLGAMAQQPDTTSALAKKSKDSLVSTRQDTDVTRSFKPRKKSEKVFHPDSLHSPHKAVIRSLIIPGWGQAYNHSWWKIPIIYAGLGLLGDAFAFNNKYYHEFLAISKYREFGITPVKGQKYYVEYNEYINQDSQALYDATNAYARNRDLSLFGFLGAWGINMIDAYIDAKFMHSYTVDNNFSMKIRPSVINQPVFALNPGMGSFIPALTLTVNVR